MTEEKPERTFNEGDMFTYVNVNDVTCVVKRGPESWAFISPQSHVEEGTPMSDQDIMDHVISLLRRQGSRLRWGFVHTGGNP